MISFYPGPSRVYEKVPDYVQEAYDLGYLSINHRSEEFMGLVKETSTILKKKLKIPEDYSIFYLSSATECWQIIAQAYELTNYHFYNGAFGNKWFEHTKKIKSNTIGYRFDYLQELKIGELDLSMTDGIICITQNETSNGTQVANKRIAKIRKRYPTHLIAVDATSSMGGIKLEFSHADIWYASVQKCFGLPAGMAVMVCSPKAIELAKKANKNTYYNSLVNIASNMDKFQTTHTPNVLGIYLLNKTQSKNKGISKIERELKNRMIDYYAVFNSKKSIAPLVINDKIKSKTVIVLGSSPEIIEALHIKAQENKLILGNGYGELKSTTFRIANFPAIKKSEVNRLLNFLDKNID
jgi:phosphoserine aminotransferase